MNTIVTSKKAILEASQKTALETGLESINIRNVAARCGISVGSVYNYFPSKADLIGATVKSVWETIFHNSKPCEQPKSFIDCIIWLFERIQKGSLDYPTFFTLHSMSFAVGDKEKGRELMAQYFAHMKTGLLQALTNDKLIRSDAFSNSFTQTDLIDFVFSNILNLSMKKEKQCNTLIEIIRRTIY